jgi:hypothetical protein
MGADGVSDLGARISGATSDMASRVTGAIRDAARATGAGFEYLLNTAARESNFDPNAKSPNSSATGLFQFLDQTWLATLKTSGPGLGYGRYADAISQTPSGAYTVSDPAMMREIMALRKDPNAAAMMGGALANANAKTLTEHLGRKPTDGELYIAHFLGAGGAVQLIRGAQTTPNAPAATMFPRAAAANGPVFYDRSGAPRSLRGVYDFIVARHDSGTARFAARPAMPAGTAGPATTIVPTVAAARQAPVPAAPPLVATANQTAVPATTQSYAVEIKAPIAQRATGPMFYGLYNDGNRGAVAPVVRELWGVRHGMPPQATPAASPASPAAEAVRAPEGPPMNLFQFLRPDGRGAV